jgi:16S rRNA (guanine527-N7)-methyltransferase
LRAGEAKKIRPLSLGQASRISGVRNSDLAVLIILLEGGRMSDTLLERGTFVLGIPFGGREMDLLRKYREEVTLWNRRLSLVGAEGDAFVVRQPPRHPCGFRIVRGSGGERIADVGSGGGLPAFPLPSSFRRALLLGREIMKKGTFLSSCVMVLGLRNVEVLPVSLEMLRSRFDIVTFRAFRSLQTSSSRFSGSPNQGDSYLRTRGNARSPRGNRERPPLSVPSRLVPLSVPFWTRREAYGCLHETDAGIGFTPVVEEFDELVFSIEVDQPGFDEMAGSLAEFPGRKAETPSRLHLLRPGVEIPEQEFRRSTRSSERT